MFQRYCRRRWVGAVVATVSVMARGVTAAFDRALTRYLFRNGIESGITAAFTRKGIDGPGTKNNIAAPGGCGGEAVRFVIPKRGKAHHTEMTNLGSVQRGHRNQWPFDTTWSTATTPGFIAARCYGAWVRPHRDPTSHHQGTFPQHELRLHRPNWLARHGNKAGGTPDVVNHYDVVAITATTPCVSVPPAAPAPGRARRPTRRPRRACPAHRHRHPCRHGHPDRPRLRWARNPPPRTPSRWTPNPSRTSTATPSPGRDRHLQVNPDHPLHGQRTARRQPRPAQPGRYGTEPDGRTRGARMTNQGSALYLLKPVGFSERRPT